MNNDEIIRNLDKIVQGYQNARDQQGVLLSTKYSQKYVYTMVQKHLFDLEAIFNQQQKAVIDVFEFLSSVIKFTQPEDCIFVIVQVIDFFKAICEENQTNQIKFSDLSNYLCKYNPNLEDEDAPLQKRIIQTFQYPPKKMFNKPTHRTVRSIDLNAPVVLGTLGHHAKRINRDKIYLDSQKNQQSLILKVQYQEKHMRLIVLHQYSDCLTFYKPDCTFASKLRPKAQQLNNVIMDFCWSEEQQRLGAVFKDSWISFYDSGDKYQNETFFTTKTEQLKIYYVQNKWLTTSADSKVSCWDLQTEQCAQIVHESLKQIVSIVEVQYLQLVCIACVDKLTLWDTWDIQKPKLMFKLQVNHTRLNTLVFFESYHMLLTTGFDNKVNIYQLHKKYNDGDFVGQLEGHTSIITAIQCVEQSPIVATSDDKHTIKLWDIRAMKCVQSFDLELRQQIGCIVILNNLQAITFATSRLMVMNFEASTRNLKNPTAIKPKALLCFPCGLELDAMRRRLIVATAKDIRILNLANGQQTTILKTMINQSDDEICTFKSMQQHKKLIVGTTKGMIKIFDSSQGELVSEFQAHQNRITNIQIDYANRLMLSSSLDGKLVIYKENSLQFDPLRKIENIHKGVDTCHLSLYHNLIITGGVDTVSLWSYEFGKLIACITNVTPKGLHIMNESGLLVIGECDNTHLIKFVLLDDSIQLTQLATIQQGYHKFVDKQSNLIAAAKDGTIALFDLAALKQPTQRMTCNPFRSSWDDYETGVTNHKVIKVELQTMSRKQNSKNSVQAHRKKVTHLDFIQLEGDSLLNVVDSKLMSSGKDGFIKIFTYPALVQLCSVNINHPLPYQWNIKLDDHEIIKFKLAFALKIIHFLRTQCTLTISMARLLDPFSLLKNLISVKPQLNQPKESVPVLTDEYEARDLIYNKIKDEYQRELQGPSLNHIQESRKAHIYQQQWIKQDPQQPEIQAKQSDEKQKEQKWITSFLHPNYRNKQTVNEIEQLDNYARVEQFERKLDRVLLRPEENKIVPTASGRRISKLSPPIKGHIGSSTHKSTSRVRQSDQTAFFQYANTHKLGPSSTDISLGTSRLDSQRADSKRLTARSYNPGSLLSDLEQSDKKRVTTAIGENVMRKTSGQLFNQIVQRLDKNLRESKYRKFRGCKSDLYADVGQQKTNMINLFKSLSQVPRFNIVFGYTPKRSPFDKTQYIENYVPRQIPFPKSRRPRLPQWEDQSVVWPQLQPSPVVSRAGLIRELEAEELKRLQLIKPLDLPDFRVGDVIEFKWVHNMSEPKANIYQGLVVARRNKNSLEGGFKVIFRYCGTEVFMYVKQNSPYLRDLRILKRGSGDIRNRQQMWRRTMSRHELLQPLVRRSMRKRRDDPDRRKTLGQSKRINMMQDEDPLNK